MLIFIVSSYKCRLYDIKPKLFTQIWQQTKNDNATSLIQIVTQTGRQEDTVF